jgi:hypothetical protein
LQIMVETLAKVVQLILTLLANHKALQATFPADAKEILMTLNITASKALEGPQPNKYFAALLLCLAAVPETVQQRGEAQVETYKTLTIKCMTKLTKQHFRADNVRVSLARARAAAACFWWSVNISLRAPGGACASATHSTTMCDGVRVAP